MPTLNERASLLSQILQYFQHILMLDIFLTPIVGPLNVARHSRASVAVNAFQQLKAVNIAKPRRPFGSVEGVPDAPGMAGS